MALLSENVFNSEMIAKRTERVITDSSLTSVENTQFSNQELINRVIAGEVKDAYTHMRSGQHPNWKGKRACSMMVLVYHPIDDGQSKRLNDQRAKNSNYFGGGAAGVAVLVTSNKAVGLAAGAIARKYALEKLRSWDAGDILVRFEAKVSGGIGPQGHVRALVVKRSAYDPNNLQA